MQSKHSFLTGSKDIENTFPHHHKLFIVFRLWAGHVPYFKLLSIATRLCFSHIKCLINACSNQNYEGALLKLFHSLCSMVFNFFTFFSTFNDIDANLF